MQHDVAKVGEELKENDMKQRIQTLFIVLLAIGSSAMGQTLSVEPIEVDAGSETTLVVSASGLSDVTALQFNLKLPEGITLVGSNELGDAANAHTLDVRPLASGDNMFVFYNLDKALLNDGVLIRIPVSASAEAQSATGSLYTFHTATTDAVSHELSDASFSITVKAPAALKCATPVLTFASGKVKCTCETTGVTYRYTVAPTAATGESTTGEISFGTTFTISVKAVRDGYEDSDAATLTIPMAEVGDVNADGNVTIADVTTLVNIILGK